MWDQLKSIAENLAKRLRSPFTGAFLASWFVHNWKLVYTVFNFDENSSRIYKISKIEDYLNFWDSVGIPIIFAFIVIILLQVFNNLTHAINRFFERYVKVWIFKKWDGIDFVTKEEAIDLEKRFESLQEVLDAEERKNAKLTGQINDQTETIKFLQSESVKTDNKLNELENLESSFSSDITPLVGTYENHYKLPKDAEWDMVYCKFDADGNYFESREFPLNRDGWGNPKFQISDIVISEKHNIIKFNKTSPYKNIVARNVLLKVSEDTLAGGEDQGTYIKYRRVNEGLPQKES